MAVKHSFVSAKANGADTSLVRPVDWNAEHVIEDESITYVKLQQVSTTDRLLGRSSAGAGVVEEIVCTAAGRALLDDADATAQKVTLGLAAIATSGSGADLTASSVTYAKIQDVSATDRLLGRSTAGAGVIEEVPCTAAGRALLDDADASAQRTTLGLAAIAASGSAADLTTGIIPDARMPNLTGDVTTVEGAVATTIANDAVTYAKMQNVSATDKLLGRSTAGAGDVEEIACTAAGRALLDDATAAAQRTTLGLGSTLLGIQKFTANGTYTPTAGTTTARVRMVGGGGSGGSASTTNNSGGTGGGSGEYVEALVTNASGISGGTVTVGAAQTTAGSTGNNTSLTIESVTITAQGGGAGTSVTTASGGHAAAAPTLGASGDTSFDTYRHVERGQANIMVATTPVFVGGNGASGVLGRGGNGANGGNTAGGDGTGYGAGGGGATRSTTNQVGGDGAAGVVIIEEYKA